MGKTAKELKDIYEVLAKAEELKDIYGVLAAKEAMIIEYDNDITRIKRIITNNLRYMKRLSEQRDKKMKEIIELKKRLELLTEVIELD